MNKFIIALIIKHNNEIHKRDKSQHNYINFYSGPKNRNVPLTFLYRKKRLCKLFYVLYSIFVITQIFSIKVQYLIRLYIKYL